MPVILTGFFLYRQQQIRHEIKIKLKQQYLQTIVVPAKDFVWVKYKKEIRVQDRLFDVKTYQLKNNKYYCTGLFDDDETALNVFFAKTHKHSDEKKAPISAQLFKILQCLYTAEPVEQNLFTEVKQTCYISYSALLSSPFAKILTPPPQL